MNPTFITDLTRIVLAAELSTRREFNGLSRDDPRMLEIADQWMHRPDSGRMSASVSDANTIAWGVWYGYMRPHVVKMLIDHCRMNRASAEDMVEHYFYNDAPQYHPEGRRR